MAVTMQQISPMAHLPLVLGVVRKLKVATLIETFCPPHPAHVLSCGRGVEALLLAMLDGPLLGYYRLGLSCSRKEDNAAAKPSLSRGQSYMFITQCPFFFREGGEEEMPLRPTDDDRGRRTKRATATRAGGRLHARLFDCIQRVYASTPPYAMDKRPWLLQRHRLPRRRSRGQDISAAS